ncbi:MAG: hypothetical protein IPP88_19520 [Betaproteobacteria bacterium]|nr:hypothetical protein [Betaproteobacteria bacterium]
MDSATSLKVLKADFLATSTQSMPYSGIILWTIAGIAGLFLTAQQLAYGVAFGSGLIFPLAVLIDRLRGRNLFAGGRDNPLTGMFLQSIIMVVMLWPLVIMGAAGKPLFIVLGAALLTGIIWIPYGWAADDPVGMRHAMARAVLCYSAYLFVPASYKGSAICAAVLVCYFYSIAFMQRGEADQRKTPGAGVGMVRQ